MKKLLLLFMCAGLLINCSDDDEKSQRDQVYKSWTLKSIYNEPDFVTITAGEYTWDFNKAEGTLTVSENFSDEAHAGGLLPDGIYEVDVQENSIEVVTEGFEDLYYYTIRNGKLEVNLPVGHRTNIAPPDLQFESL